jgi:hypothetical protein
MKEARKEKVLKSELGSILRFRIAQYWGTYRGLNHKGGLSTDLRARLFYPKEYGLGSEVAPSDLQSESNLTAVSEKHGD